MTNNCLKNKRILIVSPMPPRIGGVSVSSGRLYDNLKADGYVVEVYNTRPVGKFYNTRVGIFLRFLWIPFFLLFRSKYDIIHCHVSGTYRKLFISIIKPLFFKGAKLIYTLHGDVTPLLNKTAIFAMSKADWLICVQKGDSDRLPEILKQKSNDIPAFIMPTEVTEESISGEIANFVYNKDVPLILFYGSVVINNQYNDLYGINDAVDLYMYLKSKQKYVRLLMFLTYKNFDTNIKFVNELKNRIKNEKNILLVENGNNQMLPLFKYSNLYIRPSKTDGDSLAVRESLSMKCPVVASDKAVRPKGTLVYKNKDDFFNLSERCISGDISVTEQENFYNQIKDIYGNF